MPDLLDYGNKDDWMVACVPKMIDEGKDQEQDIAACSAMWENRDEQKDTLVMYGGSVKALGGGKIGGYLVRFTSHKDTDLEGEFFTAETDFGEVATAPVYYQHGMDYKLGKRRIGKATHKMDEFGIWAEAQLDMRDEYEKFIYEMAEAGKMGWSSGTAGHLVEREPKGKAVWLKSWPLGLDDTLTPTPAEPRNSAVPLKSWQPASTPDLPKLTLVERIKSAADNLKNLSGDLRVLVDGIDRPLSEIKRDELKALLESCSGFDAVRNEMQSILTAQPKPKPTEVHWVKHKLAEYRRRQQLAGEPAKEKTS